MRAATIGGLAVRLFGSIMVVLGLAIWTGRFDGLIPMHVLTGLALVATLWSLVALAARAGVAGRLAAVTLAWSVFMPAFGLVQEGLLPGNLHLAVQVAHLAVGIVGLALGARLALAIERSTAADGQGGGTAIAGAGER